MNQLYNFTAHITFFLLKIYALFNKKVKLFVKGRQETFQRLSLVKEEDKVIWFHAASLGEFEQARPIIEEVKKKYSNFKIVVTFFSPSGYEIRKDYPIADWVFYLPPDSKQNADRFLSIVRPSLAIFVKYEFWFHYLY